MATPSLRKLLLQLLIQRPDGKRECTLSGCSNTVFSGSSDSAVWRNHFATFHAARLQEITQTVAAAAAKRKASSLAPPDD